MLFLRNFVKFHSPVNNLWLFWCTENSTHSKKEENSTQKLNKLQHIQLILVNT